MSESAKPGLVDRLRARFGWFDHAMRANERFKECRGNYFAAGLTYYTIFALFPLLMVGFGIGGFVLSRRPDLLNEIDNKVRATVPGNLGQQVIDLMNSAIDSRASVGIIGLATAGWAGLSWMANLREALSGMWQQRAEPAGFVRTKLSDLVAMLSSFVAILATLVFSALVGAAPMAKMLGWLGIHNAPVLDGILRGVSLLVSLLVSWLVFTWMIARLPRESVSFASSVRAGLLAAVGFEVFKQIASIFLQSVLRSPASATFGPVLGLMVFAYITARLLLFATAWAATSAENLRAAPVEPPAPAVITPRVQLDEGLSARQALTAAVVGAVGALGLSRLVRRNKS
ncbi:inner membrane protein YhjD [Mycobacterium fragae]|uniref:Inner membrane protein YhjD n=1 Tax=Mycobacterium fragae TaxID=1260918 RepID=A0A1X1UR27_9MYCO|nr:inner membrane protein YhjD [Mycobacterium fragae]MCV7401888.1 inner membrane protein YhjD [Mycobacterium fragae]ORV59290.1 inner membrane protein YhjD [Mycobacterium fragae]